MGPFFAVVLPLIRGDTGIMRALNRVREGVWSPLDIMARAGYFSIVCRANIDPDVAHNSTEAIIPDDITRAGSSVRDASRYLDHSRFQQAAQEAELEVDRYRLWWYKGHPPTGIRTAVAGGGVFRISPSASATSSAPQAQSFAVVVPSRGTTRHQLLRRACGMGQSLEGADVEEENSGGGDYVEGSW